MRSSALIMPQPLIFKALSGQQPYGLNDPSIVPLRTTSETSSREPNARERRSARDKQGRYQRQREVAWDAAAFAYFKGWPLRMCITITWDTCLHGAREYGHILGLADKERDERLRSEIRRVLREAGHPFACLWARDEGGRYGLHTHLSLYWPLPPEALVSLLARLTGSLPEAVTTAHGVLSQSECGGWQIKHNTSREEVTSAMRWTAYLLEQEPRHLIVPRIAGKVLGVSRTIDAQAIKPHREALEAWKQRRGLTYVANA